MDTVDLKVHDIHMNTRIFMLGSRIYVQKGKCKYEFCIWRGIIVLWLCTGSSLGTVEVCA
jgi:hypothetical protein